MRLKELREEAGMTQKQLAEKIGNVQRNISNWESGKSQPDLDTVVKLAEIFSVTTDELLGRNDYTVPPHGFFFIDKIDYSEDLNRRDTVNRIADLAERLSLSQQKALVTFLESITEKS